MSDKISASVSGSRLPPDAHNAAYNFLRQRRQKNDGEGSSESDTLNVETSQTRYREDGHSDTKDIEEAVSFTQTQAAFLGVVENALDRMKELSLLCQDATKTDTDRADLTVEFTQLQHFISDIGTKKFNGVALFTGATLKIGDESDGSNVPLNTIEWASQGSDKGVGLAYDPKATTVNTTPDANAALFNIHQVLENIGHLQDKVSANLHRLNLSNDQLLVLNQNLSAANNRINDIDWARKLTDVARFRILGEAVAAKSAQANAKPQTAMRLLGPQK